MTLKVPDFQFMGVASQPLRIVLIVQFQFSRVLMKEFTDNTAVFASSINSLETLLIKIQTFILAYHVRLFQFMNTINLFANP